MYFSNQFSDEVYMSNPLANLNPNDPIYKYCINKGRYNPNFTNSTIFSNSCRANGALPLSKTNPGLNTSTNNTAMSCRMKYAQQVNTYGTVQSSTSYPQKTCSIGGPTFRY